MRERLLLVPMSADGSQVSGRTIAVFNCLGAMTVKNDAQCLTHMRKSYTYIVSYTDVVHSPGIR